MHTLNNVLNVSITRSKTYQSLSKKTLKYLFTKFA